MSDERGALLAEIQALLAAEGDAREPKLSPAAFVDARRPITAQVERPEVVATPREPGRLGFSIMFFSAAAAPSEGRGLYDFLLTAAERAEGLGFEAAWLPERHFNEFGGPYPAPSVLMAAVAARTTRIRLRSGSIILPLHHPVRVAEAWSVIDNLSGGRVELGFGSGWSPKDFVLSPADFAGRRDVLVERLDQVRRLWRGEKVEFPDGLGNSSAVEIFPKPRQAEPPIWIASTGSLDTFRWAGRQGFDILTMVLGGDLAKTAAAIAAYRDARREAGHDPDAGRAALMLHTLVHPNEALVADAVREPFGRYVRSALEAQRGASEEGRALSEEQRRQMAAYAVERYTRTAALFGSPASCEGMLAQVAAAGIDEVASLIDFGVPDELALEGLSHLAELRARWERSRRRRSPTGHAESATIAVVGIALRLPGSNSMDELEVAIRANRSALAPPPAGRFSEPVPSLSRAGFIDGIELFDPAAFGLAPAEAAAMDPHHRLLLQVTRDALADAAMAPDELRGEAIGVFSALYSTSHAARRRESDRPNDPLEATGSIHSMAPNRISHLFDWSGPSEIVATACSSGLVAVHRAMAALRRGECRMALASGASLLLSDTESAGLRALGVLAPDDRCRAFAADAAGQARGEGAVALLLKPLAAALADGDPIHGVLLGSATNHAGGGSGSLTLPNANRQSVCITAALADAGSSPAEIGYIEGHGAGSPAGDTAELAAFRQAWTAAEGAPGAAIASIKPAIGALDAAGGLAGLLRALVSVEEGVLPGLAEDAGAGRPEPLGDAAIEINQAPRPWPIETGRPRRALVHAYGLGGVNADVVVEQAPSLQRAATGKGAEIICLSARTPLALRRTAARLGASIRASADRAPSLADIALTLRSGRAIEATRWSGAVKDIPELLASLDAIAEGRDPAADERLDPVVAQLRSTPESSAFLQVLRRIPPTAGARRVHLPAPADEPLFFPLDGGRPVPEPLAEAPELEPAAEPRPESSVVANFYDYVTRPRHLRFEETYLTLAPFPEVVPGFSWTSCMQDPARRPDHHALMLERQREMRRVAFAEVDFDRVGRMLDIGCGLGTDLIVLAQAHPGLEGLGFTLSAEQAQAAGRRIAGLGLASRLQVQRRDSSGEPFPGRFDLVIGFEVAHHVPDKERLFANVRQALAPGGHLVLADTMAGTVAPVSLAEVGSFTLPRQDYADLFTRHGLAIRSCIDLSQEIANFLDDPAIDSMLASEERVAVATGRRDVFAGAAAVQRSWHAFGQALREGLMLYILVDAIPAPDLPDLRGANRHQVGAA